MLNFFHKLFNPHCPHCAEQKQEDKVCSSCETLKEQLAVANAEKKQLLDYVLMPDPNTIHHSPEKDDDELQPIQPKVVPWRVRRQMLEDEDRKKALLEKEQKAEQAKAIAELEKNLGVVSERSLDLTDDVPTNPDSLGEEDVQSQSVKSNV